MDRRREEESYSTLAPERLAWDAWNCKILLVCIHCKESMTEVMKAVEAWHRCSLSHPMSYCRQQASLKSVTGDSSAWIGCPLNHLLLSDCTAFSASSSCRNYKKKCSQNQAQWTAYRRVITENTRKHKLWIAHSQQPYSQQPYEKNVGLLWDSDPWPITAFQDLQSANVTINTTSVGFLASFRNNVMPKW